MPAERTLLALNAGSSSLKYALFRVGEAGEEAEVLARGSVEASRSGDAGKPVKTLCDQLDANGFPKPDAVGHRLVHGGPRHLSPVLIDPEVRKQLEEAIPFAPLHLPSELRLIDAVAQRMGKIPQVACFDTGFHRSLPEIARRLPLPERFFQAGIRRYGFHGLSYEYVVATLGGAKLGRAVIAHLGSGASLCAARGGLSIDTTMSFTPTAGLVMSTRCGDLDPGVLIYLIAQEQLNGKELEHLLNHESGLLAISERTGDIRDLEEHRTTEPRAALALEMFCRSIRKGIGAMAASLSGIDSLVFTGGAGASSSVLRGEVCRQLGFLGVELDEAKNKEGTALISSASSRCAIHAIQTDEETMIARHTARVLNERA